MCDESLSNKIN